MLGFTRHDIETLTRPVCSARQLERKLDNYQAVEACFESRSEVSTGLPIELNLEPSGYCNLRCSGCPRGRGRIKRTGNLPYPVFEHVLAQLGETLCNVFISGFGEPLCNPETPQMIALATAHGSSTVMNTNGTYLEQYADALLDAQLTLINVALDGAMPNSYHLYTSKDQFEATVRGVETLRQRKDMLGFRRPLIEGQFLIREDALDEIPRLEQWAIEIGIERVKFKRPYLSVPGDEERPAVESVTDYLRLLGLDYVRSTEQVHWTPADCALPWENLLLSCDGQLGICCYDPHLKLQLNEPSQPLDIAALWNGEKCRRVRRWLSDHETRAVRPCSWCNRMPGYLLPA